jgi:hypothetical protein
MLIIIWISINDNFLPNLKSMKTIFIQLWPTTQHNHYAKCDRIDKKFLVQGDWQVLDFYLLFGMSDSCHKYVHTFMCRQNMNCTCHEARNSCEHWKLTRNCSWLEFRIAFSIFILHRTHPSINFVSEIIMWSGILRPSWAVSYNVGYLTWYLSWVYFVI